MSPFRIEQDNGSVTKLWEGRNSMELKDTAGHGYYLILAANRMHKTGEARLLVQETDDFEPDPRKEQARQSSIFLASEFPIDCSQFFFWGIKDIQYIEESEVDTYLVIY